MTRMNYRPTVGAIGEILSTSTLAGYFKAKGIRN